MAMVRLHRWWREVVKPPSLVMMGFRAFRFTAVLVGAACLSMLVFAPRMEAQAGGSRTLPSKFRGSPYSLMSLSVGHPNDGWQVRAKKLRRSAHLRIKSSSRSNAYGHPALVLMLRRSAREIARAAPGSIMVVGDLSRRDGGPLAGHASHQSGRDADVGFFMRDAQGRMVAPDGLVAFDGNGRAKDGSKMVFDDRRNWLLVQSWVRDHRAGLSHIFVSTSLRARLLAFGQRNPEFRTYVPQVAALLKQPENSSPHDDHFHVRIACPRRQAGLCHENPK